MIHVQDKVFESCKTKNMHQFWLFVTPPCLDTFPGADDQMARSGHGTRSPRSCSWSSHIPSTGLVTHSPD